MKQAEGKYLAYMLLRCLHAEYFTVENSGSFAVERDGDSLYVLFEKSNGVVDWENNLDFAMAEARRECVRECESWYAHGGFLRVWRSILPYIEGALLDLSVREVISVGYSHGAALALLCHEYIWYSRPDIRSNIYGFGFGCPRVVWGTVPGEKDRWRSFYRIKNYDDIVTHLPPRTFGFRHVGREINIGGMGRYSRIDAHRSENYIKELDR